MPRAGWAAIGAALAAFAAARASESGIGVLGFAALLTPGLFAVASLAWATAERRAAERRAGPVPPAMGRAITPATIGAALIVARLAVPSTSGAVPASLPGGSGPWQADVLSIASPRDGQQLATLVIEAGSAAGTGAGTVAAEPPSAAPAASAPTPAAAAAFTIRVAATLPRYPAVAPGDRLEVRGILRPPKDDDYGARLRSQGIAATLRSPEMRLLAPKPGLGQTIEGIRRAAGDALSRVLPEPEGGLAQGILIGLRDRVDRDLAAAFTTAGVSHVVAISGWNIAIVGALVAALLGRWPRRRRAVATLLAVTIYTVLAGASPSVVRAALMAGVVLTARESGRAGRAATGLGWAILIMLTLDPGVVDDAGFGLSVMATAGLLAWGSGLSRWLAGATDGRLPGWVAENLGVSLAAQAWTLPIVLAVFGRLAVVAPIVNLAVVPLVAPAMAAGALALVGGCLAEAGLGLLGTLLALPAWVLLGAMVRVVQIGAGLPFASVTLEPPMDGAAGLLAAAALLLAIARGARIVRLLGRARRGPPRTAATASGRSGGQVTGRRRRVAVALLAIVIVAVPVLGAARADGRVHVIALDVGQGDAVLLESARGGRLLVDGGPDPDRLVELLDARFEPWDRRIDLLVLTHPHEDHVAGLPLLLDRYRVGRIAEPGMPGAGPGYDAWLAALRRLGRRSERLATGDRMRLDEIGLAVLWPDADRVPPAASSNGATVNGSSIVLLGEVGGQRLLLTGDAEEGIDPFLLARGVPRVDVLKVAHHGSPTSSSQPLLARLRPAVALISVGEGNTYGHPGRATLSRLSAVGARAYRTDFDGTIDVTLDGASIEVRTERPAGVAGKGALTAWRVTIDRPPRPPGPAPFDVLYHRADVRSGSARRRRAAAFARSPTLAPAPLASGRRSRRLAGRTGRGTKLGLGGDLPSRIRPPPGRGGRAAS